MSDATVRFSVLCSMFQAMVRNKTSALKRKHFRKFLDYVYSSRDYFSAVRLILPPLDRERGSYGLKESVLATCLIDALGISRESEDALRLVNWRKAGSKVGVNAGNFALVAAEVLQRRQGTASGGLTIKELNDSLDRLASSENRGEKTSVLSDLIKKTNALEMKWIIMIILKDLKLGVSEKSIFHEFHPDAEDLFNVTCDLKLVCEKLKDRAQRHKRQDIEVGKPVRPQLALRVSDAATAWKKLHGKQVVVECKFDGDRIQIHKNGTDIHFFSRNFIDHPEYGHSMSNLIIQNIMVDRCILDGEMLVWDTSANRFAEFGSNQEIAKAAKEGLQSDRQVCLYVAFDILYVGDTSVIHQSLKERHELLRKVVKPLKGRLEILVPNGGLNVHSPSGEPCWSLIAFNVEEVERFFKETIENRDEGIVLKDLGSKWEPSDRSGKWLKLKPDYIRAGCDLDVLIIGGYFGSGRHGGEVAQFLVALAERATPNAYPKRFISFCRVGTGLSDDELDTLITKLKPYFRKNEHPKKAPSFYEVTNNSKERPDVWIDSPEKSIILSITSDIRTIKSTVFAAPYSLRFPRIDRVRYDKPWHECLDVQSFVDLVHSSNGNAQRGADLGGLPGHKSKPTKSSRKVEKKTVSVVPSHLTQTDVSGVKGATYIFTNMMFYFVNVPPSYSLDSFHKMVAENGGAFSMNLNDSVTHCIAAEKKGIKYQATMLRGDIIHYSWVLDCCSQKRLLPLQPKYFLFFAGSSKHKLQEEVDAFSDYYYCDLDITDLKQLFSNMDRSGDPKRIHYYKKKYCPMEKWRLFQDCCVYFFHSMHSVADCKVLLELAMRRLKLEVSMYGGEISNDLSCATHLVVFSVRESDVAFDMVLKSIPAEKRHFLHKKQLHVVGHQWLEDSLEKGKKLQEDAYNLKPEGFEEADIEEQSVQPVEVETHLDNEEKELLSTSPNRDENRKRGRPANANAKRGRASFRPARKTRARHAPAKIDQNESENSFSSEERSRKEENKLKSGSIGYHGITVEEKKSTDENERLGSYNNSCRIKTAKQKDTPGDERGRPTRANAKRGRVGLQPARRTRARHSNKPAKIDQNESENGFSSEESSKKEETESKSGSVDHHGIATEEKKSTDENVLKRPGSSNNSHRIETTKQKDAQDDEDSEGSDNLQEIEAGENKAIQEVEKAGGSGNTHRIKEEDKGTTGKLELMIDPVQAMLLDMIPTLNRNKAETEKPVVEDEKPMSLDENPLKKKKVSYKDVAGELLKDW
ncbi:DNA ligase 4 [Magnolia sinica]|uniref:DNA ligase 4 n=1 Tax=Magnolia sinica TaxID=86752 RepID=UPI00265953FF|nr:DNA ligase 4 [Magnolia sinica]